ncbi:MAG: VOC family protein [Candidatus Hodarchaeales archaeon]|jgi:catechol 2,3-dioxygenase-like lactoylglutathione lyase family enzyme
MKISYHGSHTMFFATHDIEKTIRFYRDFLGFRLFYTVGDQLGQFKLYLFEVDERLSLAFFSWPDVQMIPKKQPGLPVKGMWGFDHIMIGMETEDDLFFLRDKFLMAGLEISEVVDHGFVYSIYAFDPNNISLEFSYEVYNTRGLPMFTDMAPPEAAEEGAFPQKGIWPDDIDPTPIGQRRVIPGAGWNLVPPEMKNAKTKFELPESLGLNKD